MDECKSLQNQSSGNLHVENLIFVAFSTGIGEARGEVGKEMPLSRGLFQGRLPQNLRVQEAAHDQS